MCICLLLRGVHIGQHVHLPATRKCAQRAACVVHVCSLDGHFLQADKQSSHVQMLLQSSSTHHHTSRQLLGPNKNSVTIQLLFGTPFCRMLVLLQRLRGDLQRGDLHKAAALREELLADISHRVAPYR